LDLQQLLIKTKSKAIFLINEEGVTVDFYPKDNDLGDLQEKISVFKATIFSMSNHFFKNFLNTDLTEIILKSDDTNMLLIKHNEFILCFLTDTNIGLLELILKKNI